MIRRFVWALTVTAATLLLPANAVPGRAAEDISQHRPVTGFDRVRLQGAFKAEIAAGQRSTSVVVTGDPDLVARVTTEVRDRTLFVGMRSGGGAFQTHTPKLTIALPALRSFSNDGASSVRISGLAGGDVSIANAGAAAVTASGRASKENVSLKGTGKIDAAAVQAGDVTVENDGIGAVYVRASGSLTMNLNGIGEIRYAGNPKHVESHVNGIGHIGPL
jgi:hypothetical protein